MSKAKTPLQLVKDTFGEKTKLLDAIKSLSGDDLWVGSGAGKALEHVSNAKLMRLHKTFDEVKGKFGTRAKLLDAVLELEKRAKDEGYKKKLAGYPVARLYDQWKSANKRATASKKAAAGKAEGAKPVATAATAKAPAAKKKSLKNASASSPRALALGAAGLARRRRGPSP